MSPRHAESDTMGAAHTPPVGATPGGAKAPLPSAAQVPLPGGEAQGSFLTKRRIALLAVPAASAVALSLLVNRSLNSFLVDVIQLLLLGWLGYQAGRLIVQSRLWLGRLEDEVDELYPLLEEFVRSPSCKS